MGTGVTLEEAAKLHAMILCVSRNLFPHYFSIYFTLTIYSVVEGALLKDFSCNISVYCHDKLG
jgi:hypothetical protein